MPIIFGEFYYVKVSVQTTLSCQYGMQLLYKSQPSSQKNSPLVPQTNFLQLWHGNKNPWRYALKYFKTILPRTFLCLPC